MVGIIVNRNGGLDIDLLDLHFKRMVVCKKPLVLSLVFIKLVLKILDLVLVGLHNGIIVSGVGLYRNVLQLMDLHFQIMDGLIQVSDVVLQSVDGGFLFSYGCLELASFSS